MATSFRDPRHTHFFVPVFFLSLKRYVPYFFALSLSRSKKKVSRAQLCSPKGVFGKLFAHFVSLFFSEPTNTGKTDLIDLRSRIRFFSLSSLGKDVQSKWNEVKTLVPQRDQTLQDELKKQQNNEALRRQFAEKSNQVEIRPD